MRKSLGETKKKKRKSREKSADAEKEDSTVIDDDESIKGHCVLIEKECNRKEGSKDYKNMF